MHGTAFARLRVNSINDEEDRRNESDHNSHPGCDRLTPSRDTMTEHIIVADEDSTRTITMRRPEKKNTLMQEMYLAMRARSRPIIRRRTVRKQECEKCALTAMRSP